VSKHKKIKRSKKKLNVIKPLQVVNPPQDTIYSSKKDNKKISNGVLNNEDEEDKKTFEVYTKSTISNKNAKIIHKFHSFIGWLAFGSFILLYVTHWDVWKKMPIMLIKIDIVGIMWCNSLMIISIINDSGARNKKWVLLRLLSTIACLGFIIYPLLYALGLTVLIAIFISYHLPRLGKKLIGYFSNMVTYIIAAAIGGIIGNRADWLFVKCFSAIQKNKK